MPLQHGRGRPAPSSIPRRASVHASAGARQVGVGLALCVAAGALHAASCEEVMAPIEARIRAKGVTEFRLEAVDRAASAGGQQVGTCDLGRKKILYLRGAAAASSASSASLASPASPASTTSAAGPRPAGPRASGPRVITECADGRVIEQGSCRKK